MLAVTKGYSWNLFWIVEAFVIAWFHPIFVLVYEILEVQAFSLSFPPWELLISILFVVWSCVTSESNPDSTPQGKIFGILETMDFASPEFNLKEECPLF